MNAARDALAPLLGDAALRRVLAAIDRGGDETRIVGGAVRDALTGRPVKEIDLATTATPDIVLARAERAGIRVIPTGIAHGTITLLVDGETFETTSLREDVDTDGRHAQVRFGRDFSADALRRDFTINALFLGKDGQIFDYVGGLDDLAAGRVRFIGEPAQRIREDYLRILRFFRFSADFSEGPLDAEGLLAAMRERAGLARLSRERVRAELLKLLVARRAVDAAQAMSEAGLLGPLLASAPNPARLRALTKIADAAARDPLLRLAALCLELPEDAERLGERLRLSNAERQRLERAARALIKLHGAQTAPPDEALRRLLFLHGREAALDALLLAAARAPDPAQWAGALAFLRREPEPRLPFSGADLIARGVPAGRAIGAALETLKHRWIGAGFPDDPGRLARMLDEVASGAN
ncbi:MAG: CCA tRNA nucleotidyltransferase [Methylocella sp.]